MQTFIALLAVGINLFVTTAAADCPTAHGQVSWEASRDYVFPNVRREDPVDVTFKPHYENCLQNREALDKPRLAPRPNATSFEIYGFSVLSRDNANESVSVSFYLSTGDSLPGTSAPVSVGLQFSFADGGIESFELPAVDNELGAARLTTEGAGSRGTWGTTGAGWKSNFDGTNYVVEVESDELGIHGILNMTASAPPHYPCTTELTDTTTLEVFPGSLGWTNQIPDAQASAKFTVTSASTKKMRTLNFDKGFGWHDQTWSDRPWLSVVKKWTHGRASIGSKSFDSINWFQGEDCDGKVHTSAYLARQGKAVMSACETVGKRGEESLVKVNSEGLLTVADILIDTGTSASTYKVELYKDLQLQGDDKGNGMWSGVAVGGPLRGQGIFQAGGL